jgi:hypothetical protein
MSFKKLMDSSAENHYRCASQRFGTPVVAVPAVLGATLGAPLTAYGFVTLVMRRSIMTEKIA